MTTRVFTAHDPGYGIDGTDIKVEVYDDGTATVALREGRDETWHTWGPTFDLLDASVLRVTGGTEQGRVVA